MAAKASRVTQRLKEAVGGAGNSYHRNNDLSIAAQQYNTMKTNLNLLVKSLRAQHHALVQLNKTRMEIARSVAQMTMKSPLYDCTGKFAKPDTPHVVSYATVHNSLAKQHENLCEKYNQFVVAYAVEWQRIVNTRVSVSLKKAETLRRELDHYSQKVESLRTSFGVQMAKGKNVDAKSQEKLARNEEKLKTSKKEYGVFAQSLCMLIDEIVNRAWKDLQPLLVKMAQFDTTMSASEANTMKNLNVVIDQLKGIGQRYDLRTDARLKDLETKTARELYSGDDPESFINHHLIDSNDQNALQGQQAANLLEFQGNPNDWSSPAITSGDDYNNQMNSLSIGGNNQYNNNSNQFNSNSSNQYNNNNQFNSNSSNQYNNNNQFNNNDFNLLDTGNSARPTTSDMLEIAARSAPPPTFDMLNDTAAPSGAPPQRPPPPPPMPISNYPANNQDYDDNFNNPSYRGGSGGYDAPTNDGRGGYDPPSQRNDGMGSFNQQGPPGGRNDSMNSYNQPPRRNDGGMGSYDQPIISYDSSTHGRNDNLGGSSYNQPRRNDNVDQMPNYDRGGGGNDRGGGSYNNPPGGGGGGGYEPPRGGNMMSSSTFNSGGAPYQPMGSGNSGGAPYQPMGSGNSGGAPYQPMGSGFRGGDGRNNNGPPTNSFGSGRPGGSSGGGQDPFGRGNMDGPPSRPNPW
eukprot:CAMPEP_0172498512 /NCGR_PEP_ID=MMETSP1066-20121228/113479_1 /TAXON_ID=671091 /ORGANISM="Coscinodiscus wailesii, Strain CCMP2513" /LENGTH=681 /DNA_ID=CAMNT_0013271805 /DNA_START=108 /DNA_END=2153 /DNA_ORIENTATION=-